MAESKTWKQRISVAEQAGKFGAADAHLADCWDTCAVAEGVRLKHKDLAAKHPIEVLINDNAVNLGCMFSIAVQNNKVEHARDLYKRIMGQPTLVSTLYLQEISE